MGTPQNGSGSRTGKLPQWVFPVVSLLAITVILTLALYKFQQYLVQQYTGFPAPAAFPSLLFFGEFLWVGCVVLTISFLIYVFNWLRKAAVLLEQIAMNTRAAHMPPPKPLEQGSQSAWPLPPKPVVPAPEDQKYMPKV
jgi:hypothetical protein